MQTKTAMTSQRPAARKKSKAEPSIDVGLSRAQAAFCHSKARYRALCGGRGAGKTFAGAYDMLTRAGEPDAGGGRLYGVYAPTYTMLRDATWRMYLQLGQRLHYIVAVNNSDLRVTLSNKNEIVFRSMENPERARGLNLTGVHLDEASLMERDAYNIVIASLRDAGSAGWLSATFTPKGRQHWTYEVFGHARRNGTDVALFRARTFDNPFLAPEFYDSVRRQYTNSFARQELEGEFIEAEGALFKRQWFRVVDAAPEGLRWVRYWDLAASTRTSADYTASAEVALGRDGTLYIRNVIHGRWEWPDARSVIIATMQANPGIIHLVEKALHGLAAVQELSREQSLMHVTLIGVDVDTDKVSRAMTWAARAERGQVALVAGAWIADFLDEVCAFPGDEHDDQVDAVSGAVAYLGKSAIVPSADVLEAYGKGLVVRPDGKALRFVDERPPGFDERLAKAQRGRKW